jgi:N utilization substance protein A
VDEDQLSLAIGKHGQNVRLAARFTGWDIDILTPEEYNQGIELLANCIKTTVEDTDDTVVDKLIALGVISIPDLDDVGVEPLVNELKINSDIAEKLVAAANREVERLAAESKQNEAEKQLAQQTKAADNKQ